MKPSKKTFSNQELPRLRLRVTAATETILRGGHPWLFAQSIKEQNRAGITGELAVIFDRHDKFLAVGLYDSASPLRVRILHRGKPAKLDREWWRHHFAIANGKREHLFDGQTTGYRCINGESDGWPGLVLDRYSETAVLKLYTAAWLPWLADLTPLIITQLNLERLVLRLSRNSQEIAQAQFKNYDGEILHGSALTEPVIFVENGIRFEADVLRGQKTGFFLDQRDNRSCVETLAAGKKVLNAFSFSGGFSLYAARGGATSVTDVDISAHALESSRRNFALNKNLAAVTVCRHELAQADVFEWLATAAKAHFDLVIIDPPSLAKRELERAGAIQAYQKLATLGISTLSAGGILLAASCSAHVTAAEFFDAVRSAAIKSRRTFTEIKTTGHAPDHAATFKEAEYLKAIYLKFEN